MTKQNIRSFLMGLVVTTCTGLSSTGAYGASMNLGDAPLFVSTTVAPLTMLVMGRDHKLYYEAYNDASDLNGDGVVDSGYQGYHGTAVDAFGNLRNVDYYGYFNSYVCYNYDDSDSTNIRFVPASAKTTADINAKIKTCAGGGAGEWSGDYLNYVTTARIDAVRKVFYGGYRWKDDTSSTVLERTHIPQDAHAWGKEYASIARDGFDIADYTNLSVPEVDKYHLFANVSLSTRSGGSNAGTPRLRVLNDTSFRVWEWLSKERPVAGLECQVLGNNNRVPCEVPGSGLWGIVPDSAFSDLVRTTYDITAYGGAHPTNNADFINLEAVTKAAAEADENLLFGSDNPSQINGSGNPHGSDENYLTIFEGEITVPTTGLYTFSVDGDDAIEISIDGDRDSTVDYVTGWYGGHGSNNSDSSLNDHAGSPLLLTAGIKYDLKYRHEEAAGGDSYYLYWDRATPASVIEDYIVRVEVCTAVDRDVSHETNTCQAYPNGGYKPTGLLHDFGEDESMMFGLLSGSYENNLDGGVLRKGVSSFTDEIIANTGEFNTSTNGIVSTIDKLRTMNFNDSSTQYDCWVTNRPINNRECDMWGNPVAEMMYESLRYFAGKASPTSDFNIPVTGNIDAELGLPLATWTDPYDVTTGYDECALPFQVVVSDINPSYDSNKLPGIHSDFGASFTGDVSGLNVTTLADTITAGEGNIATRDFFIGQSGSISDDAPTSKTVASLGSIRGMAPEEPSKLGSYYSASLAYYGFINDVNARAGDQNIQTFSVALASPLPTIDIDVDNDPATDNSVVLVPFAKTVGNASFQPTNQIVDFYVESLTPTSGSFLVNYEDVEQGADHDMDAIARYTYAVNGDGTLTIDVDSIYAGGGAHQHMGYVISGTTQDGVYLEVKDIGGADINYALDTPAGVWVGDARGSVLLGLNATRTFTPSSSGGSASFLKDPLWYAAKWGGFIEGEAENDEPDLTSEWDSDNDGDPDNYFLVTNALTLKDKMEAAFDEILARSGSSSTVTVSSGSLNTDALLFQALFDTDGWVGVVKAIEINETTGALESTNWEFSDKLRTQLARTGGQNSQREVITVNGSGNGVPFRFPADYTSLETDEMTSAQVSDLLSGISSGQQSYGEDLVDYIRGDSSEESGVTGATRSFREREGAGGHIALGDIVHSDPLYVTAPGFFYGDSWPTTLEGFGATAPENSATQKYSDFRTLLKDREPVLYVGANDGMLHGINAYKNTGSTTDGGEEIIAFVPGELYSKLPDLADSSYTHDYFVDGKTTYGDVFFAGDSKWHTSLVGTLNGGGQSVFSLDITDPKGIASGAPYASFDESNAEDLVLWEFSDADDPDLGFTFGRPTIVRLANGQWGAVFGNGYDNTDPDGTVSSTGNAAVFIVNIETGALIKKFDTEQGFAQDPTSTGQPNGMSEAAPVDIDGDFIADYIYAGDLFGNMWKIDISHPNSANWGFSYASSGQPAPLYEAKSATGNRLPITQRPQVGSHPLFGYSGDVLVYFGTGKYLENSDNSTVGEETQSYFAIWDDGVNGHVRSDLVTQTISEYTDSSGTHRVVSSNEVRWEDEVNSSGVVTATKHHGWVLDLLDSSAATLANGGERTVNNSILRDGRIIFSTLIPSSDACASGGTGWVLFVDAVDGGAPESAAYDANNDGELDNDDMIDTDGDGIGDTYGSGTALDGGIPTMPAFIDNTANDTTIGYSTDSEGNIDTTLSPLDALVNKRLYWRELR